MNKRISFIAIIFAVIAFCVSSALAGDIVDSFESASKEEMAALFKNLIVDSDASNESVLILLRSNRTIKLEGEEMPAVVVGLNILMQRQRMNPVFYPDLFSLALQEHKEPKRDFGWFSPTGLLARIRQPEFVPFLIDQLNDENLATSRLAAQLLGQTKDKRAVEPLEKRFLTEGDPVASVALYTILEGEMVPILLRACESHDPLVREIACNHFGNIGDPETLPCLLRLLADDGEPGVRAKAAFAMRFIENETTVAALKKALTDPSPLVKFKSAYTLACYKKSDAGADILVDNLNTNDDESIREEAARGLIYVTTPQAEDALCRALASEKAADVRYLVPIALAKHGSQNCLEPLFMALTDEDKRVRRNSGDAIIAIVERHPEESVSVLTRISKQGSDVAREQAERCLRKLNF